MSGAGSTSITGITCKASAVSGKSPHWRGNMASKSVCAKATMSDKALPACKATLGAGSS